MKPASAKEIRDELKHQDREALLQIVLRLSRFKKENKELLTYLLFDANDEEEYKQKVKAEMDDRICRHQPQQLLLHEKEYAEAAQKCQKIQSLLREERN